jgi:hypothetical protein
MKTSSAAQQGAQRYRPPPHAIRRRKATQGSRPPTNSHASYYYTPQACFLLVQSHLRCGACAAYEHPRTSPNLLVLHTTRLLLLDTARGAHAPALWRRRCRAGWSTTCQHVRIGYWAQYVSFSCDLSLPIRFHALVHHADDSSDPRPRPMMATFWLDTARRYPSPECASETLHKAQGLPLGARA